MDYNDRLYWGNVFKLYFETGRWGIEGEREAGING